MCAFTRIFSENFGDASSGRKKVSGHRSICVPTYCSGPSPCPRLILQASESVPTASHGHARHDSGTFITTSSLRLSGSVCDCACVHVLRAPTQFLIPLKDDRLDSTSNDGRRRRVLSQWQRKRTINCLDSLIVFVYRL